MKILLLKKEVLLLDGKKNAFHFLLWRTKLDLKHYALVLLSEKQMYSPKRVVEDVLKSCKLDKHLVS